MAGGEQGAEAAELSCESGLVRRASRLTDASGITPFTVGEVLDVPQLGSITVESYTQRNWSRVGVANMDGQQFFIKQFVDRVGGRHDKGYDGDRTTQELLGDRVGSMLRVVPILGRIEERLIAVSPLIPMQTIDSIGTATKKHRGPAAKVGEALAEILREREVSEGRVAVWKGLDPKNIGWTADGELWLFDFGPPTELETRDAAARVMAAGLLSRWVARPGFHLVWPERGILRGVCEPVANFTDYALVQDELRQHAELRRREPQRVGWAATATRLGLQTLGRIHWWAVEREARRLFARK
ncbi:MAG: hypothetical protein ACI9C1_001889 [Candidatus Aldehydirespiratoraceae bacterium]|jgi:hypothetical protein